MLKNGISYQLLFVCLVLICFCNLAQANKIIYVDDDAAGANNGSSWQNAYIYLQDALTDANSSPEPVEIRIAQGIYKPDLGAGQTAGDRNATFELINDVTLSGGYAGIFELDPNEQDFEKYGTILSGDLAGDDIEPTSLEDLVYDTHSRLDNSIHVITNKNNVLLEGLIIANGNAIVYEIPEYGQGGGIFNDAGDLTLLNCTLLLNASLDGGGGICNSNGNLYIKDCNISKNFSLAGAGLGDNQGNINITNSIFEGNYAKYGSGGLGSNEGDIRISECLFEENYAGYSGAGLYISYGKIEITNCIFEKNTASTGGGLYNYWSDLTLRDCIFNENSGGGIHNTDYPSSTDSHEQTLINCTFTRNSAGNGGGMQNVAASPIIINCKFIENYSSNEGGGLFNDTGKPVLNQCEFIGNVAARNGGGIHASLYTTLNKCIISGNLAYLYGGGIYNDLYYGGRNIQSPIFLNECTLNGNRAGESGGGIFDQGRSIATISNTILWANTAPYGNHITLSGYESTSEDKTTGYYSSLSLQYSNIQGGDSGIYKEFGGNKIEWLEGNIDIDPLFADPGYWDCNDTPEDVNDDIWFNGDYHLKSQAGRWDSVSESWIQDDVTSPCIDAGDPNTHIGLEPFPNGGYINMCAYGGTSQASKSYFGKPVCETIVAGDINGDCKVDILDFEIMMLHWLEEH